jgi:hypothetical protein
VVPLLVAEPEVDVETVPVVVPLPELEVPLPRVVLVDVSEPVVELAEAPEVVPVDTTPEVLQAARKQAPSPMQREPVIEDTSCDHIGSSGWRSHSGQHRLRSPSSSPPRIEVARRGNVGFP